MTDRSERIQARESKRLMRSTKADLIGMLHAEGQTRNELEEQIAGLEEIVTDLEIRLEIDGRDMGAIERRIEDIRAKLIDPSAKQLAHLEIAANLARILDRGGENERSAAATAKQLDAEIITIWASVEEQAAPKPGLSGLRSVS